MKVLVVGTGAREHAIADGLKDDVELYCYMSKVNPGMSKIAEFKQGDEGKLKKLLNMQLKMTLTLHLSVLKLLLEKVLLMSFKKMELNVLDQPKVQHVSKLTNHL